MFSQINHQIPHMNSQMPIYPNAQQQQQGAMMYPKQMITPPQQHQFQVHSQFIEAEQQIQQEIQQLQQLQLQLKLRQQQFVHNIQNQGMTMQSLNQNPANSFLPQYNNQGLLQQLQHSAPLNAQNNYPQYHSIIGVENCDPAFSMISQNQLLLNNEVAQQQQMMQMSKYAPHQQQQMQMYQKQQENMKNQQSLNRKRTYDISIQLSKIEDSNETLSPESNNNFPNKKICTEEVKSSSTLRDYPNKQANFQNMNFIQNQNGRNCVSNNQQPKFCPQTISETSSTQSFRNKQNTMNAYGMDFSFQSNSASINNTFAIKKEAKNELNAQFEKSEERQEQEQNSSDNQDSGDKRCKKEIQNDSNYTKNLLKGFRRHMNKKFKDNKEGIDKFQQYFYNNTLSNEFILILLESSPYQGEFEEFLQADPSWWIKEAKIKEPTRQLKFFETVKSKNYTDIRTKRKGKASQNSSTQIESSPAVNNTVSTSTSTTVTENAQSE